MPRWRSKLFCMIRAARSFFRSWRGDDALLIDTSCFAQNGSIDEEIRNKTHSVDAEITRIEMAYFPIEWSMPSIDEWEYPASPPIYPWLLFHNHRLQGRLRCWVKTRSSICEFDARIGQNPGPKFGNFCFLGGACIVLRGERVVAKNSLSAKKPGFSFTRFSLCNVSCACFS